jgi:hypothetical protein
MDKNNQDNQVVDVKVTIDTHNIGPGSRLVFKKDPQAYYVKSWVGDIQKVPDKKIAAFVTTNSGDTYKKFLRNLVKVDNKLPIMKTLSEGKCNCGCGGCSKAPLLNEQLVSRQGLSEGILYHIDNKKPLTEHLYRAGSEKYFQLWSEARMLYSRDLLEVKGDDLDILLETDLGHFGLYENQQVPLDFIFEEIEEELDEAKKEKKKNPPLNKPKRGGSKKFYVYVRDPKSGNIKKVSFGQEGMSAKINNSKARAAFSKRHNCPAKKDKTKASYWSCRLPRYAKQLGLKSNFSGFW